MVNLLKNLLLALVIAGSVSARADYKIDPESLAEDNFWTVQSAVDDLYTKVSKLLSLNDTVRKNLFTLFGNKGKRAFQDRLNSSSKLQESPFLVRVTSDYQDEATRKWLRVSGMGTLVKLTSGRLAVITASHVSQGQHLRVSTLDGREIPVVMGQRLANIDHDVELILLQGTNEFALVYDAKTKAFLSPQYDLTKAWPYQNRFLDYAAFDVSMKHHVAVLVSDMPNLKYARGGLGDFSLNESVPPFHGKNLTEKTDFVWDQLGGMQRPLVGAGFISISKMPPGLSGAPLMRDMPPARLVRAGKYQLQLDGVVLAQHRFQNKTFYADASSLNALVQSFEQGKTGLTTPTRWRMRSGLTFRDYGHGKLEAVFIKKPSASFLVQSSGNAVSIDSGNAVSIDSGNGVSIDSGNAVSMDSGNAVSIDSGGGLLAAAPGLQFSGRLLKKYSLVLPVISSPNIESEASSLGFKATTLITPQTDLYELAQYKTKYENRNEHLKQDLQCFYTLSNQGLSIDVILAQEFKEPYQHLEKSLYRRIELSRGELAKGFAGTPMIYKGSNFDVNISGFFITDLASAPKIFGVEDVMGPTLIATDSHGKFAQVSCFKGIKPRVDALKDFEEFVVHKAYDNIKKYLQEN